MSIQDELAAVQAQGGQGALNQWLASTSYTPAELSAATGYNVSDIVNAQNSAQMAVNPYEFTNTNLASQAAAESWSPSYAATQDDLASIRALMAQQGAGYMVTGNASLSNGGDTTAYLPHLMQQAGITPTQGILNSYQGVTGSAYTPGSQTAYNPATGKYDITGGGGGMMSPQGVAGVPTGQFGGGAATGNRSPEQLATIKGTWNQFMSGQKTAAEIQQAMTQYGVNFADISAATGIPVGTLQQQLGVSAGGTPQPTTPQPPANMGSPYNPGIITPNPDGSGTPYGSTHPKSGMVGGNTGGGSSYDQQLNNYYNAYFKDAPGVDQGMLSNWYDTPYNPTPTGFSTANKGASSAQGLVKSLDWGTPTDDAKSTPQLFNYMNMYGLTTADVAKSLGFTEQQIIDHFKKYGIDVTALKAPTPTEVIDNSATGDGPQRSGNNRSGI